MQSSPDQHSALQQYNKSLSLIVEAAIRSELRSIKKEIQDKFDGKVCRRKYYKPLGFY